MVEYKGVEYKGPPLINDGSILSGGPFLQSSTAKCKSIAASSLQAHSPAGGFKRAKRSSTHSKSTVPFTVTIHNQKTKPHG